MIIKWQKPNQKKKKISPINTKLKNFLAGILAFKNIFKERLRQFGKRIVAKTQPVPVEGVRVHKILRRRNESKALSIKYSFISHSHSHPPYAEFFINYV